MGIYMQQPLRVLHVLGTTNLGGAESRIMDLYRHIDRSKVQFDFVNHMTEKAYFDDEIKELGGNLYHFPRFKGYNYFAYKKAVRAFFKEHNDYCCVQGHMTSTASIYLPIAKKSGVLVTAAHARSAGVDRGMKGRMTLFLRRNLSKKADCLFACSRLAGEVAYGKRAASEGKTIYIPNAIDVDAFAYQEEKRNNMREKLGISGRYVFGHVGRFHYAKNHEFLIKVFCEICKRTEMQGRNPVLILLGEGSGMEEIKRQAQEMNILENVLFLGNCVPVADYYQAMDYMIYPSRFEGLPGTVVEAQASGLRCLISDAIAEEVLITDLVKNLSINISPVKWADRIISELNYNRDNSRIGIIREQFDVKIQADKMTQFYTTGNEEVLH